MTKTFEFTSLARAASSWLGQKAAEMKGWLHSAWISLQRKIKLFIEENMIGPMEKGFKAAEIQTVPNGIYEGIDLKILPQYICYKAALIREKTHLQFILLIICCLFATHYCSTKSHVASLTSKLREKEYILAPGVLSFTKASPQSVSDEYISDATSDFLNDLGNFSPSTIDHQYNTVKRFMSDTLKVQFDLEFDDWVKQVKSENISQILNVTQKEITTDDSGRYRVVALARVDFYSDGDYLGHEDQAIEMSLSLTAPREGQRWYLQIDSLNWNRAETFRTKKHLSKETSN